MNFAIEIVGYGVIVPVTVAITVVIVCQHCLPESLGKRYAAAAALAAGFFVGYAVLPSWAELVPTRHWHWLPYLGVAAMIVGPIGCAGGVTVVERWLLTFAIAVAAAWLLVPTWESLQPPRSFYIPLLAGYLSLLACLLDPLAVRVPGKRFWTLLSLTAVTLAASITAFVSVRYGRIAGVAAAAIVGCNIAAIVRNDSLSTRSALPAFSVVIGGSAFVGFIEPTSPLVGLLLIPAAPLTLWLVVWGLYRKLNPAVLLVIQIAAVLAVTAVAVAVTYFGNVD